MNIVFIIPTGIGASMGGHAADATPVFKLFASISDIAITHPNVVNASDINEMPENTWYVEGSILDRFLEGKLKLKQPYSNKILLVTNKPIQPETINAINAARYSLGCEIESLELNTELRMVARVHDQGADGSVYGWRELVDQIKDIDFDALAIATGIECEKAVAINYLKNGGINPWGGVEAVASKLIANAINKPVAHAPVETDDDDIRYMNEISPPRNAAEMLSMAYIHCVFKGLHKAPRISDRGLSVDDIDCLVSPYNCFGRPHKACIERGIPIIGVKENTTALKNVDIHDDVYWVDNYMEAVGYIQSLKAGVSASVVSEGF